MMEPGSMKQRLIQQVGRSARLNVINELKRSQGMCVADLATRLGMSYMGVKGVCLDLEKRGLVDTWRSPQKLGRPQMLYRLTTRSRDLFPTESNGMTLELLGAAQRLFGATAPEKLLLVVFQGFTSSYAARMPAGDVEERASHLVRLRDGEGYMSEWVPDPSGWRIVEHHSLIIDLLRAFPIVARLETEMFQKLLGCALKREERTASGLFEVEYRAAAGANF